jgi:NADH dehydrogenase [ubiquinone] 1 alpha subcomplex assembly factor 7
VSLRDRLAALIAREGPIPVSRYMALCLHDPAEGYYATRPSLGESGDFITAPLVSQIFGELLGLWAAEIWSQIGRPTRCLLVELGPGHGVMMTDVLRAGRVAPGFLEASELWLVETSGPLRDRQALALNGLASPCWAGSFAEIPGDAPIILLANEFLDCLPIDQAVWSGRGWHERRVDLDGDGRLVFSLDGGRLHRDAPADAPDGAVLEWSDAVGEIGRIVGDRVERFGGAALFIDYGRDTPGLGDTLQAIREHRKETPLQNPGQADLTAHVDFPALLRSARLSGALTTGVVTQRAFMTALGAVTRAEALVRARPDRADTIARQLDRLIAPGQMGDLFKVAAIHGPGLPPPGFETSP